MFSKFKQCTIMNILEKLNSKPISRIKGMVSDLLSKETYISPLSLNTICLPRILGEL